jgi:hypothetical protein
MTDREQIRGRAQRLNVELPPITFLEQIEYMADIHELLGDLEQAEEVVRTLRAELEVALYGERGIAELDVECGRLRELGSAVVAAWDALFDPDGPVSSRMVEALDRLREALAAAGQGET